mmetsp:Transcript_4291/g.10190  ORF Transcript_4291/g.10190 Transcript_4291/m.10190 type:complete len:290 (-) Transcript_4291:68-937(-)
MVAQQLTVALRRSAHDVGIGGQGHESAAALECHGWGWRAQKTDHGLHVLGLFQRIGAAHTADKLQHDELNNVAKRTDLINHRQDIFDSTILSAVDKHQEGISLCRGIRLHLKEAVDEVSGVRDQGVRGSIAVVNCQHGISSHIRVAVLQVALHRRDERFQNLRLLELGQKAQGASTNKLIRVVEIIAQHVTHKDHLRQQLAVRAGFVDDLQVQVHQLFQLVVLVGNNKTNHRHEEPAQLLAVQHQLDNLFHCFDFNGHFLLLEAGLELGRLILRSSPLERHKNCALALD